MERCRLTTARLPLVALLLPACMDVAMNKLPMEEEDDSAAQVDTAGDTAVDSGPATSWSLTRRRGPSLGS